MPRIASPTLVPSLYRPARQVTPVRKDLEDACYKCKKLSYFTWDCPDSLKLLTGINELTESPYLEVTLKKSQETTKSRKSLLSRLALLRP